MIKNKSRFTIFILICICILTATIFLISNSEVQYKDWNACKKMLLSKYTFIDRIDVGGRGPGLVIGFQLKNDVDFEKVEDVFNELINQHAEVFDDLDKIHQKRDGYITQLYIYFYSDKDSSEVDYEFYSISKEGEGKGFERFKSWKIEYGDESRDYIPNR